MQSSIQELLLTGQVVIVCACQLLSAMLHDVQRQRRNAMIIMHPADSGNSWLVTRVERSLCYRLINKSVFHIVLSDCKRHKSQPSVQTFVRISGCFFFQTAHVDCKETISSHLCGIKNWTFFLIRDISSTSCSWPWDIYWWYDLVWSEWTNFCDYWSLKAAKIIIWITLRWIWHLVEL